MLKVESKLGSELEEKKPPDWSMLTYNAKTNAIKQLEGTEADFNKGNAIEMINVINEAEGEEVSGIGMLYYNGKTDAIKQLEGAEAEIGEDNTEMMNMINKGQQPPDKTMFGKKKIKAKHNIIKYYGKGLRNMKKLELDRFNDNTKFAKIKSEGKQRQVCDMLGHNVKYNSKVQKEL